MNKGVFRIVFFGILLVAIVSKLLPFFSNFFYFTVDQGRDAVYIREILAGRLFPLVGPETSAHGVFHGALWYYFITLGYFIFGGHPFGAVFMLVLLNTFVAGFLMWVLSKKISQTMALAVGFGLLFNWGFYETSRYAFNPFLLAGLCILLVTLVSTVGEGKYKNYLWAAVPVGLAFHAHIVAAIPVYIMYIAIGLLFWVIRRTTLATVLIGISIATLFLSGHVVSEVINGYPQGIAIRSEFTNSSGYFIASRQPFFSEFLSITGGSVVPGNAIVGFISIVFLFVLALLPEGIIKVLKQKNIFASTFISVTVFLSILTYFWYSTNNTWKPWQTVYLPPLIFISTLLSIKRLPNFFSGILFAAIILAQAQYVWVRLHTDKPGDAGMLSTQLDVVDWIYKQSNGEGFSVYTYTPSVLDYTYQYLFPWYGVKKYGYVPCEYASYPKSPKVFLPGSRFYSQPTKPCSDKRLLIVEPNDQFPELKNQWIHDLAIGTEMIREESIGTVTVEMRRVLTEGKN